MSLSRDIEEARAFIQRRVAFRHPVGIVLGTGLGAFAEDLEVVDELAYDAIPHFPVSTVEGHEGRLIFGRLAGKEVIAMKGRFHCYEGYSMEQIVFPIRVMKALGVSMVILSNASGGVNAGFKVGDLMIIKDHINLFPHNPLIGKNNTALGMRFPDMSEAYDPHLIQMLVKAATTIAVEIKIGVYAGLTGPCFETPAEYKYLRLIGADSVGMSTVPETIAGVHMGMKVAALSVITDMGIEGHIERISHEDVQRAAAEAEPKMAMVVKSFLSLVD